MNNSHQKKIALSLSAFVLPGLGQLHLKKRAKGWIMILLCFFDILIMIGKFMMGLLIISEKSLHQKREVFAHLGKDLWEATLLQKEWLIGGLICIILIWLWSIWDIAKNSSNS